MTLLSLLDLLGTAAFAASGAWAGVRRGMDLFGVLVLGMVTAVGGGTLRDLLLGDLPPFSLQNETYLWLSLAVALLIFLSQRFLPLLEAPLLYFDAIGLGTFAVIGTGKALEMGTGPLGAILMGVMTGTAGGVIRDVLCNQEPLILRREIYASACLLGSCLLLFLHELNFAANLSLSLAAGSVVLLRLLAIRFNWSLPKAGT